MKARGVHPTPPPSTQVTRSRHRISITHADGAEPLPCSSPSFVEHSSMELDLPLEGAMSGDQQEAAELMALAEHVDDLHEVVPHARRPRPRFYEISDPSEVWKH